MENWPLLVFNPANIFYWLCYFFGQLAYIYARADASAASHLTAWNSVTDYVKVHQRQIIRNVGIATVLYIGWWRDPALLAKGLSYVGVGFDPSSVPVTKLTSFVFGGGSQWGVEWLIQKVKRMTGNSDPPQPPAQPQPPQQGQAVGGGN